MKRRIMILLAALLLALALPAMAEASPLRVVTTVFPLYDWTREVIGGAENVELTFLLEDGIDMHSYQPSVADIMALTGCDLFIYVGGESDGWAEELLAQSGEGVRSLNLLEALGEAAVREELREGMQAEEEDGEEAEEEAPAA